MTTFSCNKLNLCFDHLSVVRFLLFFRFLESLSYMETDCTSFAKNFLQIICLQPVKKIRIFLVFLNYTSGYLKFCQTFCIFEMAWSRAFQNCIIYHFLEFFIANIFTITKFCKIKFNFCKFSIFCRF